MKGSESVDWDHVAEERELLYECTLLATLGYIENGKFWCS
jgi:hypothetical protein